MRSLQRLRALFAQRWAQVLAFLTAGTVATIIWAAASNGPQALANVCRIHSVISDRCGALGWGGAPTNEERLAWANVDRHSCEALRRFASDSRHSVYRADAVTLIAARHTDQSITWMPTRRILPLYVSDNVQPASSDSAAREAVARRATDQATTTCRNFSASDVFRFSAANTSVANMSCHHVLGGYVCAIEGTASCSLEERVTTEVERCG